MSSFEQWVYWYFLWRVGRGSTRWLPMFPIQQEEAGQASRIARRLSTFVYPLGTATQR